MMIDSPSLLRAAGYSSLVALVGLIGAGAAIALFFGGAGAIFGPINDLFVSITTMALILPVLAIDRLARGRTGPWFRLVSYAAIVGLVLIAVGQLLLVLGVIELETSFTTGGLGILPVILWAVALAALSLTSGLVTSSVGWLAIAVLVLSAAMTLVSTLTTGPVLWVLGGLLLIALIGWLATMATELLGRAATSQPGDVSA